MIVSGKGHTHLGCFGTSELSPVDSSGCPWESQTEEDVDGVGTGDVADARVSVSFVLSGGLGGKRVGEGSAHSDKGDGGYGIH
mgnify:CR=1 FL=1